MKNQILLFLITIFSLNSYAQIYFEKGYYINNSDQKIDCLIKNIDWSNNPTQFVCKTSEYSEQKTLTIESVKEFGINNISKYIRRNVSIDRSGNKSGELSNVRNPVFSEEKHFLKVLVEGKANLYSYVEGNLIRYFFSGDSSAIEPLIYKEYITVDNKIAANDRFKQQMWIQLQSPCISINELKSIKYSRKELVKVFKTYNECGNSEFVIYEKKRNKKSLNISIRPGLNTSSLSIANDVSSNTNTDFGTELGLRVGIEAEFIMPFNKNKWAVLIEPTYQYFKSEEINSSGISTTKVDYKSVELPIGIRHYFFLNDNSKMFINGSLIFDLSGNSKFIFGNFIDLEIQTGFNFAFGLGYNLNNKYSLELRYLSDRDLFYNYVNFKNDYKTLSIILGYNIFKNAS